MDASQGILMSSALVGADANGAPAWPELLGSAHWDGLIDQLDFTLRRLVLLCSDLGGRPWAWSKEPTPRRPPRANTSSTSRCAAPSGPSNESTCSSPT
ncbi:hypothetical protein ZWY2020_058489 [Hordeum vulgare]|nr:hypothetical protein ZWY2020_058489 [Hordeum vulgare]